MENLVFVPPVLPGQPPIYYGVVGIFLSIFVIVLSAFDLARNKSLLNKILYIVGCFCGIVLGSFCGYIIRPFVAIIVAILLIALSVYLYKTS